MIGFLVERFFTINSIISILEHYKQQTKTLTSHLSKIKEETNKKYQ